MAMLDKQSVHHKCPTARQGRGVERFVAFFLVMTHQSISSLEWERSGDAMRPMVYPQRSGMICAQPDQYWYRHCSKVSMVTLKTDRRRRVHNYKL